MPGWPRRTAKRRERARCAVSALLLLVACSDHEHEPQPAAADAGTGGIRITATVGSTRFVTREHFLAAGEMQISGEPLAEAMGRNLGNYSRDHLPPDLYFDTSPTADGPVLDLPGFSTGIESYEYSKQPMNSVAFESGAGTSLVYAPLVNPDGLGGPAATALLADLVQHFAGGSNATTRYVFSPGTFPVNNTRGGDQNPIGAGTPGENPLGWPGLWPTAHVFRSFDPTINPTSHVDLACAITSDDDPGLHGSLGSPDYECDATTLHLPDRGAQCEPTLTPGADGFNAWKYGLWVLNYLQSMHDSSEAAVDEVSSGLPENVGIPGNTVHGGGRPTTGVYLGSSNIEGFQAQIFISAIDNRAEDWLAHLTTTDGVTLSGFPSLLDALSYDYTAPLRWFPGQVGVSESDDGSGFPRPAYTLVSADSSLLDQVGLLLGYSEFYALTDTANADVGGSQSASVYFDGDPFAADNQLADGEASLHDRALAMLRVTLINLDRLHTDPGSGVLVDDVRMNGAVPKRGTTVSTTSVAYALLGLRTVLRASSSQLELYSNNTPDTAITSTPLDALPLNLPNDNSSFSERTTTLLRNLSDLLMNHLSDASGRAFAGWDVARHAPTETHDLLDSHTAAVRGLFAAYLATGDVRYRERAVAVFQRMQAFFYDAGARIYTLEPTPTDSVEYTPLRFALLQSALRDMYELVAARAGGESLAPVLEERLGRLNKLVLNGWDDRNQDELVAWPEECVNVRDGLPRGALQMAERSLTGETGSLDAHLDLDGGQSRTPTSDREHDCVPEIDDAHLPAALADSVTFHLERP